MCYLKKYYFLIITILFTVTASAQDLTGTWEGALSNDQFLQLNILQTGNKICGYTRDYVKKDTNSYCKAFFEGRFDKKRQLLIIDGKYFLQTSGNHFLMNLRLDYTKTKQGEILEQLPFKPFGIRLRTGDPYSSELLFPNLRETEEPDSSDYVHIKKVADQPNELIDLMKDCMARNKIDSTIKKIPSQLKDSLPVSLKVMPQKNSTDSVAAIVLLPAKKDTISVPKTIGQRKNKEQIRIEVDVKTINLKVYDNAIIDGDTISILYNGKMLLTHQLLSEKGIELNIELDEKLTRHEITLFAENLGSIPPNTALIVINAGKKRYELFASASLEENAVLVFDYKPK